MKGNISFGIGLFIAVAVLYVVLISLPLVFQTIDGKPLESIEPEPTTKTTTTLMPEETYNPETPDVISRNDTTDGKSTPLKGSSQQWQAALEEQAEQQLEQEIESAIGNQTDEEITDLITGAAQGL